MSTILENLTKPKEQTSTVTVRLPKTVIDELELISKSSHGKFSKNALITELLNAGLKEFRQQNVKQNPKTSPLPPLSFKLSPDQEELRERIIEFYKIKHGVNANRDAQRKLNKLDGFKSLKFAELTEEQIQQVLNVITS